VLLAPPVAERSCRVAPDVPDADELEALGAFQSPSDSVAEVRPSFVGYPFTLGVASGSPLPTGVVLWTRLAPDPLHGGGVGPNAVVVRWEVAEDESFGRVVQGGSVDAVPAWAHSVHVEVTGLEPGRWYFYRFIAGDHVSPVGRTRTAPASAELPQQLRFGLGSCQHFEYGYYAAHRHLVAEDLDLMVFVGDYVYEGAGRTGRPRRHADGEARTLLQYRNRHAQYKTDPDLQRLHAAVPWLLTWDDHEVANDYAGLRSESLDPDFGRRRAAAYRAYFEHMPLREIARPTPSRMVLRSRHNWGRLARFHVLDGRQRRTPQACPPPGRGGSHRIDERCRELLAPGRTMLGDAQERWFAKGLAAAPERWNFIAQQTLMARAGVRVGGRRRFSSDKWDGYPAARDRLLAAIVDNGLRSCVVLSGDEHAAYVADLKRDFDDERSPAIATEFCGTSITTSGRMQSATDRIVRENPHIVYGESARRGYVVFDVTAARCSARLRMIEDVTDRHTGVTTAATFAIDAGHPGVQRPTV
jgi:alkaline phosphatase D